MNLIKDHAGWVALVAIVLLTVFGSLHEEQTSFGGANCNNGNCTDYDAVNTIAGYYVGDVQVLNASRAASLTGGSVVNTASSTFVVGSNAASNNSGCLALGAANATGTLIYITAAANGTITGSSTKPAACQ